MNANSKKLLSLLVVVTMVLSMIPAISFQADAAFDSVNTVCDACGKAPQGGWTRISENSASEITADGHYYLDTDWEKSTKAGLTLATYDICLHLNGNSVTNTASNGRALSISNKTVNIMGSGTVTGGSGGALYISSATVNVYGGNYVGSGRVFTLTSSTVNVYGGTFNHDPSAYVDTTAYNVTAGSGTWTVTAKGVEPPAPEVPELPTECACGATNPNWVALNDCTGFSTPSTHTHYYLAEDVVTIDGSANILQLYADVCLYLNGNTLEGAGRFRTRGFNLHVFGEGAVTRTASHETTNLFESGSGWVYLHSGTYTNEDTDVALFNGDHFTITGGTFNTEIPEGFISEGYVATNNGDGTWTVAAAGATPEGPQLPTECVCGATNPNWVALNDCTGFSTPAEHTHYYLAEDVVTIGGSANILQLYGDVCLYLNGNTLEGEGRFRTRGFNLYVFGEGAVTRTASHETGSLFESGSGWVYLHSGTYTNEDTDVALFNGDHFTITGGTYNESPSSFVDKQNPDDENVVAKTHWALTKKVADKTVWDVIEKTEAVVRTNDGYTTCTAAEAAAKAEATGGYIQVGTATEIPLNGKTVYVTNSSATFSGIGKVMPINAGTWNLVDGADVVRDVTNPFNGNRYLTVTRKVDGEDVTTSYKFDMEISKVVLRPGTTSLGLGIYYKTNIDVGAELAELIDSYGVALSVVEMPTYDNFIGDHGFIAEDTHALFTVVEDKLTEGLNTVNSGLLNGFLKESYTGEELAALEAADTKAANTKRADTDVYANAYIAIDLDGDGDEEYYLAETGDRKIVHDLKGIMTMADAIDLDANPAVVDCYKAWEALGMGDWGLTNLANKIA